MEFGENYSPSALDLSSSTPPLPHANEEYIRVSLANEDIWKQFYYNTTEMIITKTGRRMFPTVKLSISGLHISSYYFLLMEVFPADNYRYSYNGKEWVYSASGDSCFSSLYKHPDSPAPGSHWMKAVVSFEKVKLTNRQSYHENGDLSQITTEKVTLHSMHKYVVKIHIIPGSDICCLYNRNIFLTFLLQYTTFIAVTAYQNVKVTQLKINNNPFARRFKETTDVKEKKPREENQFDEELASNSEYGFSKNISRESNTGTKKEIKENLLPDCEKVENKNLQQNNSDRYQMVERLQYRRLLNTAIHYFPMFSQCYAPCFPLWSHYPCNHKFMHYSYNSSFSNCSSVQWQSPKETYTNQSLCRRHNVYSVPYDHSNSNKKSTTLESEQECRRNSMRKMYP